jgi:hypothetical protein
VGFSLREMSYIEFKIIGKRGKSGFGVGDELNVRADNLDGLLEIDRTRYEYLGSGAGFG